MSFGFTQSPDIQGNSVTHFLNRLQRIRDGHFAHRFQQGDSEAFEKAFVKFRKPILKHMQGKVRDLDLAEELTQEVFLKAFRFRESFDPEYAFSTWIWTIARNTASDWFRKHGSAAPIAEEGEDRRPLDVESLPSARPDAETAMIDDTERNTLMKMMSDLTELQKEALLMRLVHQLPYQQIAKQLNISLSAVKCLVYRAKATLAKNLTRARELSEGAHLEDQVSFEGVVLKI